MTTPNAGGNLKSHEMRKDKSVDSVVEDAKDVLEDAKIRGVSKKTVIFKQLTKQVKKALHD